MHIQTTDGRPDPQRRDAMPMNAWERQQIFREMVVHQLQQGRLSTGRRKRIVQYAACLGIDARLAGRLVQEAHRTFERRQQRDRLDNHAPPALRLVPAERVKRPKSLSTLLAIVLGATMLNTWLVMHLFG